MSSGSNSPRKKIPKKSAGDKSRRKGGSSRKQDSVLHGSPVGEGGQSSQGPSHFTAGPASSSQHPASLPGGYGRGGSVASVTRAETNVPGSLTRGRQGPRDEIDDIQAKSQHNFERLERLEQRVDELSSAIKPDKTKKNGDSGKPSGRKGKGSDSSSK